MRFYLAMLALVTICLGCAMPILPPKLVVLPAEQMSGGLGWYSPRTQTIYLVPGADEGVLAHELGHHYGLPEELCRRNWAEWMR